MNYRDIPKVTQTPTYYVNQWWIGLPRFLAESESETPIDMDPIYQRGHVWTSEQRTRYVEHILRGGQSGRDIYCNCVNWPGTGEPYEIVDGKQRVTTALMFIDNKVSVFGGKFHRDFTGKLSANFIWHINDLPNQKAVMQWYLEMNAGMTAHTDEELDRVRKLLEEAG